MSMVPQFVQQIKGLKVFDRCLLTQIHYLSARKGYCFAGNLYFCEFFQVSAGTVKRSLKKMETMGLIARTIVWNKRYIHISSLAAPSSHDSSHNAPANTGQNPSKNHVATSHLDATQNFAHNAPANTGQNPSKNHVATRDLDATANLGQDAWGAGGVEAVAGMGLRGHVRVSQMRYAGAGWTLEALGAADACFKKWRIKMAAEGMSPRKWTDGMRCGCMGADDAQEAMI